jgi:SAM-dependent methyltransferase
MTNVKRSFKDKWENNPDLAFAETLRETSEVFNWIMNRNGFAGGDEFRAHLVGKSRILDAGCGNGRVTALLRRFAPENAKIIGIDRSSASVAAKNLSEMEKVRVFEKDLLGDLSDLGKFDFIYCQEVLHHTDDPKQSFLNLTSLLEPGGEIAIYVYKVKAPVREFVDDFVRERIQDLPYEEAMRACDQITALGKALSDLKVTFTAPAVDVVGIEAGEYDIQRFMYHFFMKCFWNDALGYRENTAINYDWYHPQVATRHTIEEVQEWFAAAGLTVMHEHIDHYGITVRGRMGQLV